MNPSLAVAILIPLVGVVGAFYIGKKTAVSGSFANWRGAFVIAVVIAIVFTFVQIFALGFCIDLLRICKNQGDVNMSYWFQSFLAMPLYWMSVCAGYQKELDLPSKNEDSL
jgi:ascorbate-specific PTS system EIIC-type component UlaA